MKLAHATNTCPAKTMTNETRKQMALKLINKTKTITAAAKENNVSRKFIHQQKNKAHAAINDAFTEPEEEDENVLFTIAVTKRWLAMTVVCLLLYARCPFRGVIKIFKDIFDYDISIGKIHNISSGAIKNAKAMNNNEDLRNVKLGAHDEKFHYNQPILSGTDIPSLYCYLLSKEQDREGDTWAINLLDLVQKGFNPQRVFADGGTGLRAGHQVVFPGTPCDLDNFHVISDLMDCRRYFRNRLKSSVSYLETQEKKMAKAKKNGNQEKHIEALGLAKKEEKKMQHLSESVDTLVDWMKHDVLNMPGCSPTIRKELYDFIVDEFRSLEAMHPHRIKKVRTMLEDKHYLALAFVDVLDKKFNMIAGQFNCSLETVWLVCQLQRCSYGSDSHAVRSVPLILELGDTLDAIEEEVSIALNGTERTSSMAENLHSRIHPYLFLRREVGNGFLDLLRFFLNHTPFMRSEKETRKGKTPAEILTKKPHNHWLEMLGFEPLKRAA